MFLNFFLGIAFVLAPLMTGQFFLNNSKIYSIGHKAALIILLVGAIFKLNFLAVIWPLFCVFGFFLFLKKERGNLFSIRGLAAGIPFLFSLISSAWFFAGVNDLQLLGYNTVWSFYAALHGSFLGWMFVGCLVFLSRREHSSQLYLWGAYFCLIFFLFVAFGINGIPYVKKIGVVGLSLAVPILIGLYTFSLKKGNEKSLYMACLSLFSIMIAMTLAVLNEFWTDVPRVLSGVPIMVLVHGLLNVILTVPCFFLAIRLESEQILEIRK